MTDLTMTNVWLGILATVSLIEFLMICAAGIFAYKMYRQTVTMMETVERVHIAPLRARVDALLDEVQDITDRVKHAQDSLSHVFQTASGAGSLIAGTLLAKSWPVLGLISGVRMAASTLFQNDKDRARAIAAGSRP
jgi:hypothetical protein